MTTTRYKGRELELVSVDQGNVHGVDCWPMMMTQPSSVTSAARV